MIIVQYNDGNGTQTKRFTNYTEMEVVRMMQAKGMTRTYSFRLNKNEFRINEIF